VPHNSTQVVCSLECAISRSRKIVQKEKASLEKEKKKKHLEEKRKHADYKKKLQDKVQLIARLIDYGQPCTARGFTEAKFHGGHLISRGAGSNMKYNLHNIFIQSAQSNHWQNDDYLLREGVKAIFGEEYFNFILSLQSTPVPKYTNEEYRSFYEKSLLIIKELKNNLYVRSVDERINLRNKYNLQLGIYGKEKSVFEKKNITK
jgi:hypothetical protein